MSNYQSTILLSYVYAISNYERVVHLREVDIYYESNNNILIYLSF